MPDAAARSVDDYVDVRSLLADYRRGLCPYCGIERWLKRWDDTEWRCQSCGRRKTHVLEMPCPDCGTRMLEDGDEWRCRVCETTRPLPRSELVDALTGTGYPEGSGKPGVLFGPCPCCDSEDDVNGVGGDLECRACGEFYAGQFMVEWFAYAVWMQGDDRIRLGTPAGRGGDHG